MPRWGTQDYKDAVFQKLAQGSGGGASPKDDEDHFQHFENFSSGAPRRDVERGVGEAFHPERLPTDQIQPQLRVAAEKMQPQERSEVMQDFLGELEERGLAPSWLQKMLGLSSADPRRANSDDLAKVSEYSRQNHPEVFRKVVADKPFFIRWMDKPLVAALVGVIAGKLINRAYDR